MEANKSKVYEIIPVIHDQPGEVKYYIMADNEPDAKWIFEQLEVPFDSIKIKVYIETIYF